MKRILQFIGTLSTIVAIYYAATYLIHNYKETISTIFIAIGVITFVLVITYSTLRVNYGKSWILGLGKDHLIGIDLIEATEQFLNDLPKPRNQKTAAFIAHLVYRLTRLGIVALILAMIPVWLLYQQNQLLVKQNIKIDHQNTRLDQQTHLQEAERRSALVHLFSNIMDAVDRELTTDIGEKGIRDLSPQLRGRIIALSTRLKPYRYLDADTLVSKPLSPERGQLLVTLLESDLDKETMDNLYSKADFSYADLKNARLGGVYLKYVNLLAADLKNANLYDSDLRMANLKGASLWKANLRDAKLNNSILGGANLRDADLRRANLTNANLRKTYLAEADLRFAHLDDADLFKADLRSIKFRNSYLINTNLNSAQIDPNFFSQIQKFKYDSIIGTTAILKNYQMDSLIEHGATTYRLKKHH